MDLKFLKMVLCCVIALTTIFTISEGFAGAYFNEHLPEWVEMELQFRHRYEHKSNFDQNKNVDDSKGFSLKRLRLNIGIKPWDDTKLFYQFQDSRISSDSMGTAKAGFEDYAETRQAWFQYMSDKLSLDAAKLSAAGIRFGRQELSYGAQRLVGGFNWSNIAQTFDAGKIMLEFDDLNFKVDIFGGGKTPNKSPDKTDDFYDGSSDDTLGGYYATYDGFENATLEQYVLNRNTDGKKVSFGQTMDGDINDYTVGFRLVGKIPDTPFDYELEFAKQYGKSGSLDVNARMGVAIIGYTFEEHPWKPRVAFEFDYGSGDDNPADGDRETFNNLYPTNHLHYGYMDFASLQNINNYRFQLKAKPMDKLVVQGDIHLIYLDTGDDNLYSAGRGIKRASPGGVDNFVGQEIDLKAAYTLNKYAKLLLGYSHFTAKDFLEATGPADDADFFYVQTALNF